MNDPIMPLTTNMMLKILFSLAVNPKGLNKRSSLVKKVTYAEKVKVIAMVTFKKFRFLKSCLISVLKLISDSFYDAMSLKNILIIH